jgi:hypothetical protein
MSTITQAASEFLAHKRIVVIESRMGRRAVRRPIRRAYRFRSRKKQECERYRGTRG